MKKKQFIWLLVALCAFAATGYLSVRANTQAQERQAGLLEQSAALFSGAEEESFPATPFAAKVSVEGSLMETAGVSQYTAGGYDHEGTLALLRRLAAEPLNTGLLLYINSPGGAMDLSDELYYALMDYRATGRPVYCYFGSYACSGAYYAAMASDEIWADRNSTCVNIGVYISTYNFSGLLEKYGVEQVVFRSSENKGIGLQGVPWTDEQREIYQSIVDEKYDQFLSVVAEGRHMTKAQVREKNDGREMTAKQALDAGFVDGVGRYGEYEARVLDALGGVALWEPTAQNDPLSWLTSYLSAVVPKSDGQLWQEFAEEHGGMVVMAYADGY